MGSVCLPKAKLRVSPDCCRPSAQAWRPRKQPGPWLHVGRLGSAGFTAGTLRPLWGTGSAHRNPSGLLLV